MLKQYQCTKQVTAKPMDRFEAQDLGLIRDITDTNEDGYHVIYSDDYESWSPKQSFEDGYAEIDSTEDDETWLDRLKIEHGEVSKRLDKLLVYLKEIPIEEQNQREMLVVQSYIMESYKIMLEARVLIAVKNKEVE